MALPGTASAEALTGWVAPAGANGNGVQFLNTSTIINSPNLTAESKIYSVFGQSANAGDIGVRARLFKSGALCEAIDYQYNFFSSPELTAGTSRDCGTGSYNSHGFTAVWNGTNAYSERLTFPSNPLNWTSPAASQARSAQAEPAIEEGTNANGQTYGRGDQVSEDSELPDLIAAIGTDGTVGYIEKSDLAGPVTSPEQARQLETREVNGVEVLSSGSRSVPLLAEDGVTEIGVFEIT
ncbi:hypothetical protein CH263_20225 [Rhodococcus sp. 06-1059B-a]|nr:hypothetical protein CH263_20225 [Rhodococcus sp. 06-1059B-a]